MRHDLKEVALNEVGKKGESSGKGLRFLECAADFLFGGIKLGSFLGHFGDGSERGEFFK